MTKNSVMYKWRMDQTKLTLQALFALGQKYNYQIENLWFLPQVSHLTASISPQT